MANRIAPSSAGRSVRRGAARMLLALVALAAGCSVKPAQAPTNKEITHAAQQGDPLALSDALEALIDQGRATPADRAYAFQVVSTQPADTEPNAYVRAPLNGRL